MRWCWSQISFVKRAHLWYLFFHIILLEFCTYDALDLKKMADLGVGCKQGFKKGGGQRLAEGWSVAEYPSGTSTTCAAGGQLWPGRCRQDSS